MPTLVAEGFALYRQVSQYVQHMARSGRVIAVFWQINRQCVCHCVGGHCTRDEHRTIVQRDDVRRAALRLIRRKLARNRRQKVVGRDDPFKMPIFIMDQQHRHIGRTQDFECVHGVKLIRNDFSPTHQPADIEAFAANLRSNYVA